MTLRFLLDEHVHGGMAARLRERGIDALSVAEAGRRSAADPDHLAWARVERRAIVSLDSDFIALGSTIHDHAGVFSLRRNYPFGEMLGLLELASQLFEDGEIDGRVIFL